MSRFFTSKLAGLEPYVPGEQPKGLKDLIKLNTNENPFPPSDAVIKAVNEDSVSRLRLYNDPTALELRRAIGEFYDLPPEQVFTGNGSDEVLAFIFMGLCPQGAAYPDITYGFYPVLSDLLNVPATVVPLHEDFTMDSADYAGIRKTLFIANPNAPTGIFQPLSAIEAYLKQDPDRLVVVDEAYVDFGGESAASLLTRYDNLLVVQTYSKSRQLAGGRLGFALGSAELIADLERIKFSFHPYNVNSLTQAAGAAAIRDRAYFEATRGQIMENRAYTVHALSALGFKILPSKANFIFASPPDGDGKRYFSGLRANGILVRYFSAERTAPYVRITIGTREQMDRLIDVSADLIKEG